MMGKKRKMGKINEDDTIKTMNRYGATTILTVLQEVAQSADVKIDWKTIVKRSSTGISNPREYQLLWRHLAYREPLWEEIDGAEPTDDDSDLEFELETDPTVSAEVTSQAQECVKVLMSTRFSSVSGPPNNSAVKVPNVLEASNGPASNTTPSDKEYAAPASVKNTIPVSLRKPTAPTHGSLHNQTASTGPAAKRFEGNDAAGVGSANRNERAEGFEGNDPAGASSAAKKKRKLWTEEEDAELIAAVQRCGEGNWVTVQKEHFMHDVTAPQLSQRWSTLKKRRLPSSNTSRFSNSISLAKSGVLDATRLALNNALGKPMARSFSVTNIALCRQSPPQKPNLLQETMTTLQEASDILQETSNQAAPEKGNVTPSSKPRSTPKRPPASTKPDTKTTVQEASVIWQETPNQAAPDKGNVTPSSKPRSTPKRRPASDVVQETPSQAAPEKGNVTPSIKRQSAPKQPAAPVKPENKRIVKEASDILQEIPNQAAPEKGNVTPTSKFISTPNGPPSSVRSPIITTRSLIKAAAYAAGGRIVAPSAAASLMQAAQSKNIVRIRAGGSQLTSAVSRGQQQANACSPLPFRMPPLSGNSLMMSNSSTVPRHQRRDSSNITVEGPATGAQQSSSSPANAEKMCGEETSASNGDGGLSTGVAEGAGAMQLDSVLNQDQKKSLEAGEKDGRTEKDVNVTV